MCSLKTEKSYPTSERYLSDVFKTFSYRRTQGTSTLRQFSSELCEGELIDSSFIKLLPCAERSMLSSGVFTSVCSSNADVSELCSILTGG
jgi:hypothetical protein